MLQNLRQSTANRPLVVQNALLLEFVAQCQVLVVLVLQSHRVIVDILHFLDSVKELAVCVYHVELKGKVTWSLHIPRLDCLGVGQH